MHVPTAPPDHARSVPDVAFASPEPQFDRHRLVRSQHALPDQAPVRGVGIALLAVVVTMIVVTGLAHVFGLDHPEPRPRPAPPVATWTGAPRQDVQARDPSTAENATGRASTSQPNSEGSTSWVHP